MRSVALFDDQSLFRQLKEKEVSGLLAEEDEVFESVEVNAIFKYTGFQLYTQTLFCILS